MKLATRMTVAIGAFAVALSVGAGVLQLRREELELRAVVEREALLLGRSLQVSFENALRDRQVEDVTETLNALLHVEPSVAIFVFDEVGRLAGASAGARPSAETLRYETIARGREEPLIQFVPAGTPQLLRLGLRLREEANVRASAIVLEKPLDELQRDLRATRWIVVIDTGVFVLAVAGFTWFITSRYVGRPLRRMVSDMRLVRGGNLRILPASKSSDEVGETQEEFEQLVQDLEAAHARADQEFEARRRIEGALRDADKLVTLGQLSAVMAHEIGSPLQILEGRARALKKRAGDANATRRTAEMIVEQTERITRIVRQLLSITRRRAPLREEVDAERLVRRVAALLEVEARRGQVEFEIRRSAPAEVVADGDQLQQVVLNLLRNALAAAPRESALVVELGGDAERLVLEVRDTGPGISAEGRARLFEPFFTTKPGGTGLGLSVVKSIVQEHGGTVEFVDLPAPGCRVRVTLPRRGEKGAE